MARFINKYSNQSAYDADTTKQYPNTSLVGTEIIFKMEDTFDGIIATFNVTSTSEATKLLDNTGNISKVWIDGVEQTKVINSYQFLTTGEHEVKYALIDPTTTGYNAFYNCRGLTSITIPDTVTSIGYSAFNSCSGLTSVTIPDSVTSIGNGAFLDCTSLTSVNIGNGVTSIDMQTFYGCTGLTSVTIQATTPPTLGKNAFYNTNNCPIYVPAASVDAYKAATKWSIYTDRIVAIPSE